MAYTSRKNQPSYTVNDLDNIAKRLKNARNGVSSFLYPIPKYGPDLVKDGGIDQISKEKIRNDIVDISYVTYATYFDGLLSLDKKLNAIYIDTLKYLRLIDS